MEDSTYIYQKTFPSMGEHIVYTNGFEAAFVKPDRYDFFKEEPYQPEDVTYGFYQIGWGFREGEEVPTYLNVDLLSSRTEFLADIDQVKIIGMINKETVLFAYVQGNLAGYALYNLPGDEHKRLTEENVENLDNDQISEIIGSAVPNFNEETVAILDDRLTIFDSNGDAIQSYKFASSGELVFFSANSLIVKYEGSFALYQNLENKVNSEEIFILQSKKVQSENWGNVQYLADLARKVVDQNLPPQLQTLGDMLNQQVIVTLSRSQESFPICHLLLLESKFINEQLGDISQPGDFAVILPQVAARDFNALLNNVLINETDKLFNYGRIFDYLDSAIFVRLKEKLTRQHYVR